MITHLVSKQLWQNIANPVSVSTSVPAKNASSNPVFSQYVFGAGRNIMLWFRQIFFGIRWMTGSLPAGSVATAKTFDTQWIQWNYLREQLNMPKTWKHILWWIAKNHIEMISIGWLHQVHRFFGSLDRSSLPASNAYQCVERFGMLNLELADRCSLLRGG